MQLAVIDIVCFGLILVFAIRAMLKGFVEEAFSIGAMALGIATGFFFYKNGAAFIREKLPDLAGVKVAPEVLSFIALFIIVFLVMKFIEKIISDIMIRTNLGGIDKFLGFFLGIFQGLCFTAFVFFVIYIQPLFDPASVTTDSLFAAFLAPFLNTF
ncbi:MAG: CvpA family protein [Treponema sp.]|jgi:membrane protein required for colicin V production|nr:CvpA family protein [Treponema sp.]